MTESWTANQTGMLYDRLLFFYSDTTFAVNSVYSIMFILPSYNLY